MQIDKYHASMGENALNVKDFDKWGNNLYHTEATFYVTQRKLKYAPVLGHERLRYDLENNFPNHQERRFMLQHDISVFPGELMSEVDREGVGRVRTVKPGTIMFANEPIADITGCFGTIQSQEISFEHAFDFPMTVASRAMKFKAAAKEHSVMNFSLRRNGDKYRDMDVNRFAYIGGFDMTSSLSGAMASDGNWVGTVAHYWQQAFSGQRLGEAPRVWHWQEMAFIEQLKAAVFHGERTTLLLDTISTRIGAEHAVRVLQARPELLEGFSGVRIDSGNLGESAVEVVRIFETNGIPFDNYKVVLTGDLDDTSIDLARRVMEINCPKVKLVFGVGTKLSAEVDNVAGVIFKLSQINGVPTLKCSDGGKGTLPGKLQVWRISNCDEGGYPVEHVADVVGIDKSTGISFQYNGGPSPVEVDELTGTRMLARRLLVDFEPENISTPLQQKQFVAEQLKQFKDLDNYKVIISKELLDLKEKLIHEYREVFDAPVQEASA